MKSPENLHHHPSENCAVTPADRAKFLAQFQAILECMSDAIALADLCGSVIYHNRASLALHGYANLEEAMLTQNQAASQWDIRDLAGLPVPEKQWPIPRVLRGDSFSAEAFRVRRRDTDTGYIGSFNGNLLRNTDGAPMFAMLTIRDITEQKHAEEALRSSEKRYRSLFSSMTEGFALHEIITDHQGRPRDYRFLEVNPAFEKLTGLKRANLVGRRVLDVMPGTEAYWIENYGRVGLKGEPVHLENYSAVLGRWYEVFAYQTAPMQFATIFKDITERKQSEERGRREHRETLFANRVLRAFIEYEGDALFDQALAVVQEEMASRHGVFGYIAKPRYLICPSLSKMLDACEIEGKCIHYPPEKWNGLWARALTEKRTLYTNEAPPVPPRHPIIHNNLAAPILFHGEVIGLLNIANKDGGYTDTDRETIDRIAARFAPVLYAWIQRKLSEDERKAAAAEVQRLSQQLQLALDAAKLGWWQYDPVTRVAQGDNASKAIFGISGNRPPIDELLQEIIHPEDLPALLAKVELALGPGHPQPYAAEFRIHRPDGQMRWLDAHGIATFEGNEANRRAVNLVGTVQDITESKQAEAALRESNQDLNEFGYALTHNVKAPFRAIQNYVSFLLEDLADQLEGEPRQFLAGIQNAVGLANQQFEDLEALYKVKEHPIEFESLDMRELLGEIAVLHDGIPNHDLVIETQWPRLWGEWFLLRQILMALVSNGFKYNRSDIKRVEVTWRHGADRRFEIIVRDNGIGIDPQYHDHILEIFKRLHTEKEYEGTGIGLAIVKRAVQMIDGEMRIESAVGEGSTFVIILPSAVLEE